MKLFFDIHGYITIRLKGNEIERFLNLCSTQGIMIWNLKEEQGIFTCSLSLEAFYRLKPLLRKTHTRIQIIQKTGWPFFLHRNKHRKLFLAGIFAAIAVAYLMSTRIWTIEITGNSSYSDASILEYLQSQQIQSGAKKATIDCASLEALLREQFEHIIWVSVSKKGTTLTLTCTERLQGEENKLDIPKQEQTSDFYDIIAAKDAVIEQIITRAGTPCVKPGDAVKQGDLLVRCRLDICDDAGTPVKYEYVQADADILGKTVYEYQDSFSLQNTRKKYTGEQITGLQINLPDHSFRLALVCHRMEHYDILNVYRDFYVGTNYRLPISVREITLLEYENQKYAYTREEAEALAKEKLSKLYEKFTQKGIQILGKNVMIDIVNDKCYSTGTIQVLEPLEEKQKCQIEKVAIEEGTNQE